MQIYSSNDLYNKHVQDEISEAFSRKIISKPTYDLVLSTHTSNLYTPNYFIRIALAVLTIVSITFSGLLLVMVFQASVIPMLIIFALTTYVALELLVLKKMYYNAGVDNTLMFFSAVFIASAFGVDQYRGHDLVVSGIAMLACGYLSIRFTDAFMAVLSYVALLSCAFLLYTSLGSVAKSTAPFMLMLISAFVYFSIVRLIKKDKLLFYQKCFTSIKQLTLITFYAAANVFGKELIPSMFDLNLPITTSPFLGSLFWTLTVVIPFAYLAYGIRKKDLMFIRTGLVLIGVTVLTVRYFFAVVPVEIAMLVAGLLLTSLSYALIKYLKTSKKGFSFEKNPVTKKERIDLESLIISQVSGPKAQPKAAVEFGGGSFGGGGAGSNY